MHARDGTKINLPITDAPARSFHFQLADLMFSPNWNGMTGAIVVLLESSPNSLDLVSISHSICDGASNDTPDEVAEAQSMPLNCSSP